MSERFKAIRKHFNPLLFLLSYVVGLLSPQMFSPPRAAIMVKIATEYFSPMAQENVFLPNGQRLKETAFEEAACGGA